MTLIKIPRRSRDHYYWPIATTPEAVGAWRISVDGGATAVDLEAGSWTLDDGITYTHRALIAGPDCPEPAIAGQVTLASSGPAIAWVVDDPEVPVVALGFLVLVDAVES